MTVAATSKAFFSKAYFSYHANGSLYRCALGSAIIPLAGKLHLQGTHSHFRVHSLKKGVSENEAPGPVGACATTHNNTPTPMPDRYQAVNSAVARTPCRGSAGRHDSPSDTNKHTHLRAPEKLVCTWIYKEI